MVIYDGRGGYPSWSHDLERYGGQDAEIDAMPTRAGRWVDKCLDNRVALISGEGDVGIRLQGENNAPGLHGCPAERDAARPVAQSEPDGVERHLRAVGQRLRRGEAHPGRLTEGDADRYVDDLEALAADPIRKDLRWRLAIDDHVLDESIRRTEFANWLDSVVLPGAR